MQPFLKSIPSIILVFCFYFLLTATPAQAAACAPSPNANADAYGNGFVCVGGSYAANVFGGPVGIGTTTPNLVPLNIMAFGTGGQPLLWIQAPGTTDKLRIYTNSDDSPNIDLYDGSGVGNLASRISSLGDTYFNVLGGNVGIGQTVPTFKLDVTGTGRFTGALTVASCTGCSDARLKKDIHPLENSLEKIGKLRGVHFRWREPEEREIAKKLVLQTDRLQTGLIAQDVESVFPELVTKNKDFDGIRANNAEEVKTINYDGLIAPVIEAIKELSHEISKFNPLKSQVKSLKSEVETLKAEVEELKAEVKNTRKKN